MIAALRNALEESKCAVLKWIADQIWPPHQPGETDADGEPNS